MIFYLLLVIPFRITGAPPAIAPVNYYTAFTYLNFRDEPSFGEVLDFNHLDRERLHAVLFFLTNEIRVKYRLKPLEYDPKLEQTAAMHANDMVARLFQSY
jgi:uncharacterized protein YkwD